MMGDVAEQKILRGDIVTGEVAKCDKTRTSHVKLYSTFFALNKLQNLGRSFFALDLSELYRMMTLQNWFARKHGMFFAKKSASSA